MSAGAARIWSTWRSSPASTLSLTFSTRSPLTETSGGGTRDGGCRRRAVPAASSSRAPLARSTGQEIGDGSDDSGRLGTIVGPDHLPGPDQRQVVVMDRYNESRALADLGDACQAAGDVPAARRAWRDALAILDDLDHPDGDPLRTKLTAHPEVTAPLPLRRVSPG